MTRWRLGAMFAAPVMFVMVGCGASGPGRTATSRTSTRRAATGATTALTEQASAINLRDSDLPTMAPRSPVATVGRAPLTVGVVNCGGAIALWEPGAIRSPAFESASTAAPGEVLQSAVRVAQDQRAADARVSVTGRPRYVGCLTAALRHASPNQGLVERHASVVSRQPLRYGPHIGFALSVELTTIRKPAAGGRATTSRAVRDLIGFASGSTIVSLSDIHEPTSEPVTTERRLLALLLQRARHTGTG